MEQDGAQLVRRFARGAGYGLYLRLEHAAPRPAAVAHGARELQTVSSPSESGELEPGSGHSPDQEWNVAREPVALIVGERAARKVARSMWSCERPWRANSLRPREASMSAMGH